MIPFSAGAEAQAAEGAADQLVDQHDRDFAPFADIRRGGAQQECLDFALPLTGHDDADRPELQSFLADDVADAVCVLRALQATIMLLGLY